MKVVCFCGASDSGKTTLIGAVMAELKATGARVSVIKHAHKRFDIDHAGKDSYRHREAGAYEVLIASAHRLALVRELEVEREPRVHDLLAELSAVDWVLVEGFKDADLWKVEVRREAVAAAPLYLTDPFVMAIACDQPQALPEPTLRPVFDLNDAAGLTACLLAAGERLDYRPEIYA